MRYNKIIILGGTCSGKTILAKQLSKKLNLLCYQTDDFLYKDFYGKKFTEEQTEKNVESAIKKKKWIIEGVHDKDWLLPAIKKAEIIIFLLPSKMEALKRVLKRGIKRQLKLESKKEKLKTSLKVVYWSYIYKKDSFIKHKKWVNDYKKKYIIITNQKQINELLNKLT